MQATQFAERLQRDFAGERSTACLRQKELGQSES